MKQKENEDKKMGEFGIRRSQQPQGQEHELIKPQTAEEHELTGKEVLEWLNEKMRIKKWDSSESNAHNNHKVVVLKI